MHDQDIFVALAEMRKRAVALACATRPLIPQLEGDLERLDACCAGDGPGRAFARSFVEELVRPVREVLTAIRDYVDPFDDLPADLADGAPSCEAAVAQNSGGIDIDRFRKLKEFSVPEKSIEVMAPLRDKARAGLLRLDALRSPREPGYQVAVYHQAEVPVTNSCASASQTRASPASTVWTLSRTR